jgi:NADH-quinone oxidoreductase subunit N
MNPNTLSLLPEIILTLAGVIVMVAEPCLPYGASRKPLGWLAILATFAAGAASYYQLLQTRAANALLHAFSNTIQVDAFSVFFHLLIAAIVIVSLLGSLDYFDRPEGHAGEYFALVLFGAVGMMLMTASTELLMVFVGLEISSISSYILCGFRKGQATGSESSLKYFLLGSFSTAFFLYGIALAFGATGSTQIAAIAQALGTGVNTPRLAFLALAMIVIGLGFKVSAAPFQVWTPDVYQGAPAPVVGLMSTAPKAAAFAVLIRITFIGFPTSEVRWSALLWIVAALSMTVGNLGALLQKNVKRMLAYSSIAHAGYLLAAFTAFPARGISAACFYTATYAAMNVGAFAVITQLAGYDEHHRTLDDFTGAALRRPWLGALLAFFLLSLIGIPFTGGFFGKFYVFSAVIAGGHTWLAVVGLLNSGLACFYYLRLLAALYTRHADARGNDRAVFTKLSIPAALGLATSAIATLALGVIPGRTLDLTNQAATQLLAPASTLTTTPAPYTE